MSTIKAAILGFGTVGQGIYHILNEKRDELKRTLGFELEVAAILIHDQKKARPATPNVFVTDCYEDVLSIPDVQIVFEAIIGEEPAYTYLSKAIDKGCHVITANKMMFSKYGSELLKKAEAKGVRIGFEATTAGGIPIIKTLKNLLVVNDVTRIFGILNGTSNYILTQMRKESYSFEEALLEAKLLGYAEDDPYQDISGQDAFRKLMILSELSFGKQPSWNDVEVIGIENIAKKDVVEAEKAGLRYRHIAEIRMNENGLIHAMVSPVLVGISHPLFSIEGVNNAVVVDTSYIGTLSLSGPGAGRFPTASAMVEDYINIAGKHVKQHAIQ